MMASITFDTHAFIKKLMKAGFREEQAEVLSEVQKQSLSEVLDTTLATKDDINGVKDEIFKVEKDVAILKWMTGLMFAGVISLILKAFF